MSFEPLYPPDPQWMTLGAEDWWHWTAVAPPVYFATHAEPDTVARLAQGRLRSLVQHARANSPLYRDLYAGLPQTPTLSALPPVTRSTLMADFDRWVTDPAVRLAEVLAFAHDPKRLGQPYLGRYAVWTSSGTTGVPGVYLNDPESLAVYEALLTMRLSGRCAAQFIWRVLLEGGRLAMLAATGGHFAGVVTWERTRRLHPWLSTRARTFSILEPLDQTVAALNAWQPQLLSTYPTMLSVLAAERLAGRLRINPQALWSGGEALGHAEAQHLQRVFDCPLFEEYGASECMNMAFSCSSGALHLNSDWVLLEPVDERYQPTPAGEPSVTVLVTNLSNRVQPIIRYDLGDSVTLLPDRCACGCPLPCLRVEGRRDDVLRLASLRGAPLNIVPLALETVIEEQAGIHQFQIIQSGPRCLRVNFEPPAGLTHQAAWPRLRDSVLGFLSAQGAVPIALVPTHQAPRADPISGKLRRVKALRNRRRPPCAD